MNKPITYKTLIAFQDGLLTPERMREVKQAIESDEFIKAQWEEISITRNESPDADLEVLLGIEFSNGDESSVNLEKSVVPNQVSNKWRWLVAASFVGLAIGSIWIFNLKAGSEASYASIKNGSFTVVEDIRGAQESWQMDYNSGKWENVIRALENKPDRTLSDEFYLGLAFLKTGSSKQAIPHLEVSLRSDILTSDASFALSQCYYELKDKANAQKYLGQTTHPSGAELKKLVDKLE